MAAQFSRRSIVAGRRGYGGVVRLAIQDGIRSSEIRDRNYRKGNQARNDRRLLAVRYRAQRSTARPQVAYFKMVNDRGGIKRTYGGPDLPRQCLQSAEKAVEQTRKPGSSRTRFFAIAGLLRHCSKPGRAEVS